MLQAYLYRTATDTERLLGQGIRIRLCKGAYKEGPDVAFPSKADVDANYINLMKRMVTYKNPTTGKGVFCGIATHDEAIVDKMRHFVNKHKIDKHAFEFQMLYGVRRDLQRCLAAEGYAASARLHPLRSGVVPLLHAPSRRTPRQRPLPRQKLLQKLDKTKKRHFNRSCSRFCDKTNPADVIFERSRSRFCERRSGEICFSTSPPSHFGNATKIKSKKVACF